MLLLTKNPELEETFTNRCGENCYQCLSLKKVKKSARADKYLTRIRKEGLNDLGNVPKNIRVKISNGTASK